MLLLSDRLLLWGCLAYVCALVLGAALLPYDWVKPWLSESGPFEIGALIAWLAAAAVLAIRIRPFTSRTFAFVVVCLLCAAREADLHKAFTQESLSRLSYYRKSTAPFIEKLLAGAVALLFVALLVYALFVIARFLFRDGGLRSRSGLWLVASAGLLVLTKVIDRTPGLLAENFMPALPPLVEHVSWALEEGLEVVVPLALAWSAWISQTERRYLS